MASSSLDSWNDFDTLRQGIKHNTVDRLKQIVLGVNDECNTHISKSGKKQEIIDRIVAALDSWRAANCEDKWNKAKAIIYQVKNSGMYTPTRAHQGSMHSVPPSFAAPAIKTSSYSNIGSTGMRYDPYSPRKPANTTSSTSLPKSNGLRFKESPFFQIDQAVSSIVECPESTSATDRRQQFVVFTLGNDHVAKLRSIEPKYQLKLFCTSSNFYTPNNAFRTFSSPSLVEFPPTCEVRVNNVQLTANLKGLKKKPGTAPPPDLGKHVRFTSQNRIEMVYVNSQQPVPSKKFYLVVMLVETTSVETLVTRLKEANFKSKAEIQQKMKAAISQDDDIVAGPQKMSLKCPLSFMRVQTPCRSSKCVHPQCFDATSWYSMMEQTTTWLCPVCERILDCNDLIIDGYFDDILKQTPDSVEDVMVEADGEWHTTDNHFGSSNWTASHPVPVPKPPPPSSRKPLSMTRTLPLPIPNGTDIAGNGKGPSVEIVVLDSDDEDEGRVKRELSPSFASGSSASLDNGIKSMSQTQTQVDDIIDLTLDSDDEPAPLPTSKQAGKRKADDAGLTSTSPTETIWKKGRIGDHHPPTLPSINGSGDYPPVSHHVMVLQQPTRPAPSSSPARYPPPFAGSTLPAPMYGSNYPARNVNQLPPIQGHPYARSSSHW